MKKLIIFLGIFMSLLFTSTFGQQGQYAYARSSTKEEPIKKGDGQATDSTEIKKNEKPHSRKKNFNAESKEYRNLDTLYPREYVDAVTEEVESRLTEKMQAMEKRLLKRITKGEKTDNLQAQELRNLQDLMKQNQSTDSTQTSNISALVGGFSTILDKQDTQQYWLIGIATVLIIGLVIVWKRSGKKLPNPEEKGG